MPYRDAPFIQDYRERPYPIYTPSLPRTPALIQHPQPTSPKQSAYLLKLMEALRRVVDPSGLPPPMSITITLQRGAFLAVVAPPGLLPKAPSSFTVRLSETAEVSRRELLLVGVSLRNGWSGYFAALEEQRFSYRQELLANDPRLQALLASGLEVPCPRCGETSYRRGAQEAMKLRDLPVPLLRTRETCGQCRLSRLFEELRCRRCPGLLLPTERTHASLSDSSDPELPVRESQRWRCQSCRDEIVSTSFKTINSDER